MKIRYINKDNFNMEAETEEEDQILQLLIHSFMDASKPETDRRYVRMYNSQFKILAVMQRFETKEMKFVVEFDGEKWEQSSEEPEKKTKKKTTKRKKK